MPDHPTCCDQLLLQLFLFLLPLILWRNGLYIINGTHLEWIFRVVHLSNQNIIKAQSISITSTRLFMFFYIVPCYIFTWTQKTIYLIFVTVGQYSFPVNSVTQSVQLFEAPWTAAMSGFLVHPQFLELGQIHIHRIGDAIQPSHPLSSPSSPAFSLSQHQSLFQWVSSSHQVAKVLELQLEHQSFQWIFRTDFL